MKKYVLPVCLMFLAVPGLAQSPVVPVNVNTDAPLDSSADYDVNIDTGKSLVENLQQQNMADNNEVAEEVSDDDDGNWLGSAVKLLSDAKPDNIEGVTSDMLQTDNLGKRSNAAVFDVAGVMLRMSYQQAEKALLEHGYRKTMQKFDIPNFIRWRNEEKCRNQGVVGYELLNSCVVKLARDNKYQYISQAQFNKYDTKETVNFFLTSTFTNNKVYKVIYRTEAANKTGNSPKATYLRYIKVYDFWKKINQKYGRPDDEDKILWGLGDKRPYLKAATGFLLLEDPMLNELDYTRMSREDQRFMNTDVYSF